MTRRIGIVAALPGEIKALISGWERVGARRLYRKVNGEVELLAFAGGMGRDAATRAVDALSERGPLDTLVSLGWAGGITCGLKAGVAYAVNEVIDARTGERYETQAEVELAPLRLVTTDHVVRFEEKRPMAERYRASFVDMEAATVARLASARGLPFYCWKAVTDLATDKLPDFNRFLRPNEQLNVAKLLAHASLQPRYWPALLRLGQNGTVGARALRETVMGKWGSDLYANAGS